MSDKEDEVQEAAADGKLVISGSFDITLADGTVSKRPFTTEVPVADLLKGESNG
jgi:hypothetical protein